jgi:hypothetical protein
MMSRRSKLLNVSASPLGLSSVWIEWKRGSMRRMIFERG